MTLCDLVDFSSLSRFWAPSVKVRSLNLAAVESNCPIMAGKDSHCVDSFCQGDGLRHCLLDGGRAHLAAESVGMLVI